MATIKEFSAIRPKKGLEDRIAALPYDVYSREEAREKVKGDSYTFLRIDRPETQYPEDYDMYAPEVYRTAHDMLWEMVANGDFVKDETECYYVYEQMMDGRFQTGIVAVSAVDDYLNNKIKKHENTREDKEIDRINHVDVCNAQTGPIFLTYRKDNIIHDEIVRAKKEEPIYDFTSDDGIGHKVWMISSKSSITKIREQFEKIDKIYIADGHHRCASAVKVCLKRRAVNPQYTGKEDFNFFLSVLFEDEQLMIMDYNRVVKDLNGLSKEEFLNNVGNSFFIEPVEAVESTEENDSAKYKPAKKGTFGMYLENKWYQLTYKGTSTKDPVKDLDVSILQDYLLNPVLGIQDPKTDKRIDFVGGIRGMKELERRVHTDSKVAFSMYPTGIHELFAVADAGMLMPPKSTWFEPKLRSGLFIHKI